jgi:hypothetical protein
MLEQFNRTADLEYLQLQGQQKRIKCSPNLVVRAAAGGGPGVPRLLGFRNNVAPMNLFAALSSRGKVVEVLKTNNIRLIFTTVMLP